MTGANASQHLIRPGAPGRIARQEDGTRAVYRVDDPQLERLCDVMRARAESGGAVGGLEAGA